MKAKNMRTISTILILFSLIGMWYCYYQIRLESPTPCFETCGGCIGNKDYGYSMFVFNIIPLGLSISTIFGLYFLIKMWTLKQNNKSTPRQLK